MSRKIVHTWPQYDSRNSETGKLHGSSFHAVTFRGMVTLFKSEITKDGHDLE